MLQCTAVQYSAVQYSAVQFSVVQFSVVQYSAVQCNTIQGRIGECGVVYITGAKSPGSSFPVRCTFRMQCSAELFSAV